MPSSLIIVALAAAWLVVLVPMIARKRQEIARTNDSALAARVVRSGRGTFGREEFAMSEKGSPAGDTPLDERDMADSDDYDAEDSAEEFEDGFDDDLDEELPDEEPMAPEEPARPRATGVPDRDSGPGRPYRPGRGGFDPEAAEIAARAKYAYRQRVVLVLLLVAIVTGVLAGFLLPVLWWAHGAADVVLVGYLVYLRRQVRIEEEIRQRRLARLNATGRAQRTPPEPARDLPGDRAEPSARPEPPRRREIPGVERNPMPTARTNRQAVVVDLDDEDPAFHELDDPGQAPFRRAAGE